MIFFRFAQPWWLVMALTTLPLLMLLRRWWHKPAVLRYSLAEQIQKKQANRSSFHRIVLYLLRLIPLGILALLLGKPQLVDSRSQMRVDGIDIILVLDASGSMFQIKDAGEGKSRFEVAQAEAIRFIEKRENDAIGLVIFGQDAVSRSPVTFDKKMVKDMIREVQFGDVNPDGTVLATSMITAANRLKQSKAKTKIIILLTDGAPSPHDMDPASAIELVNKLGIKVYTVGFGSDKDEFMLVQGYGILPVPRVNTELLYHIATQTGGRFFMARNAQEMRTIYDTIDQLEKSEHEVPLFTRYSDLFIPGLFGAIGCVLLELFLRTFVWFGL